MYKFVFGIEEEKRYDLRDIKAGHWPAARMTSRSSGKWIEFMDIDTKKTLNQPPPIDYKKKYVPPKRPKTSQAPHKTQQINLYKEACLTLAPQVVREIENSTYAQTMYNSPPFEAPVSAMSLTRPKSQQQKKRSRSPSTNSNFGAATEELSFSLTARSTMPAAKEPLIVTSRSRMAQTARLPTEEERREKAKPKVFDFSSVNLPETPRIVPKMRGEDPNRFPFRLSTIYLAELGEEQERKEMERAKTATARSRSVQSSRRKDKRPGTSTGTTRKRKVSPSDKNRRLKQTVPRKTGKRPPMSIVGKSLRQKD